MGKLEKMKMDIHIVIIEIHNFSRENNYTKRTCDMSHIVCSHQNYK